MKADDPLLASVRIRVEARDAWRELSAALADLGESGWVPVCASDPESFYSFDSAVLADAGAACGWCPVRELCEGFATANDERHGVWGGRNFDRKAQKKAEMAARDAA